MSQVYSASTSVRRVPDVHGGDHRGKTSLISLSSALILAGACAVEPLCTWAQSAQAPARTPTPPATVDTTNPDELDYVLQKPLFDDSAFREKLAEKGIDLSAHYISETASNTRGFQGTGTAYAQQVDFGASFDLDKLDVWSDSIAQFAMIDRTGHNLAADRTGSYFAYQEIYGQGENLRFNEISLEKSLLAKALALKVGFYPMGNDFATLPYVCNFTNVAFCGHPQSLPTDSGWSDSPGGRWGARATGIVVAW